VNINTLNLVQNNQTTFNAKKKVNFVHLLWYFRSPDRMFLYAPMKGPCIDLFLTVAQCTDFTSLMKSLVEDFHFLWLFGNKFTHTWLHCSYLTKTWWSNLIILIPDQLRWWMVTALTSVCPCCSFTSHPVFILRIFYILIPFWYFRPSGFKTIVFVNHHKSNCHKLRATCI
jgi:hypothetical protein